MPTNKIPKIVIFGRTNVGKSTLFNRLIENEKALVADIAGTTRDSNLGEVEWQGRKFDVVDTGGVINLDEFTSEGKIKIALDKETIDRKVQMQAREHLSRADLILFLVDTKAGLMSQDRQLALFLKEHAQGKKIILVANKTDSPKENFKVPEFYKLGLGEPFPISAATGSGTGDLLDEILKQLKKEFGRKKKAARYSEAEDEENKRKRGKNAPDSDLIRVGIMGKPNVGKSSLINSIFGQERVIVSSVAHTTREPQDTEFDYEGKKIVLIDTAGISKNAGKSSRRDIPARKGKKVDLEKEGINRSLKSLNRADISLLVLDISKEITRQDAKLADEIVGRKKSLIIIANKWDLIPEKDVKKFNEYINYHLPFIKWVPIIYVSALTGRKTQDILDLIMKINVERAKVLTEKELEKFLKRIVKIHRPTRFRPTDKYPYIKTITQTDSYPPEVEIKIGGKESIDSSYLRFIENQLRNQFGFLGTPISVRVKKGQRVHGKNDTGIENK